MGNGGQNENAKLKISKLENVTWWESQTGLPTQSHNLANVTHLVTSPDKLSAIDSEQ